MRVGVIDDEAKSRRSIIASIEDHEYEPVEFETIDNNSVIESISAKNVDLVLVDFKLNIGGYLNMDGLELVKLCTQNAIPSILVTSWTKPNLSNYPIYGRYVPAFLEKRNLSKSDMLDEAIRETIDFINGRIPRIKKAYETIVRIESVEDDEVLLRIPALKDFNGVILKRSALEETGIDPTIGMRLLADVNIGAHESSDIFIDSLRLPPELDIDYEKMLRT